MRTTVRIDDELMQKLKAQADDENVSLTRLLDRVLRAGMLAAPEPGGRRRRRRERTHTMGAPRIDLDKALALATALEDAEIVRKMMLRK